MPKIVEFNIPTKGGIEKARGVYATFHIGGPDGRAVRFMLQNDSDGKAAWLTHFASGMKFGSLDDMAVELACKLSPLHKFTKYQLADHLVRKMVVRHGADKVLGVLDAAPVINSLTRRTR